MPKKGGRGGRSLSTRKDTGQQEKKRLSKYSHSIKNTHDLHNELFAKRAKSEAMG